MPTNKVEPTVLEPAAEGQAKPKRARSVSTLRKPVAPKPPTDGAVEQASTPTKKAPRRKGSAVQAEEAVPTVQETGTGLHVSFSIEDISVRAYFIGEHRRSLGLSSDSEGDWLEAERQLKSEGFGIAASLRKK
jgi:hypothetical protein